jgi:hypothetical protein
MGVRPPSTASTAPLTEEASLVDPYSDVPAIPKFATIVVMLRLAVGDLVCRSERENSRVVDQDIEITHACGESLHVLDLVELGPHESRLTPITA